MTKKTSHTFGTQVSDDPTDPTIYPDKPWEEKECPHGNPLKSDCFMCQEENTELETQTELEKIAKDKEEEKL